MKTLSVQNINTEIFSMLIEIEKTGERIVICRDGQPIADLIPHHRKRRIDPHPLIRQIAINYDPTEPLAAEEWLEEE